MNKEQEAFEDVNYKSSAIDWSQYEISELEDFIQVIGAEIEQKRKSKKDELKKRFEEMVRAEGFTLSEVLGQRSPTKKQGRKAPDERIVKYRSAETGESWTGKGRKPGWLVDALDAGKKIEDFAV